MFGIQNYEQFFNHSHPERILNHPHPHDPYKLAGISLRLHSRCSSASTRSIRPPSKPIITKVANRRLPDHRNTDMCSGTERPPPHTRRTRALSQSQREFHATVRGLGFSVCTRCIGIIPLVDGRDPRDGPVYVDREGEGKSWLGGDGEVEGEGLGARGTGEFYPLRGGGWEEDKEVFGVVIKGDVFMRVRWNTEDSFRETKWICVVKAVDVGNEGQGAGRRRYFLYGPLAHVVKALMDRDEREGKGENVLDDDDNAGDISGLELPAATIAYGESLQQPGLGEGSRISGKRNDQTPVFWDPMNPTTTVYVYDENTGLIQAREYYVGEHDEEVVAVDEVGHSYEKNEKGERDEDTEAIGGTNVENDGESREYQSAQPDITLSRLRRRDSIIKEETDDAEAYIGLRKLFPLEVIPEEKEIGEEDEIENTSVEEEELPIDEAGGLHSSCLWTFLSCSTPPAVPVTTS